MTIRISQLPAVLPNRSAVFPHVQAGQTSRATVGQLRGEEGPLYEQIVGSLLTATDVVAVQVYDTRLDADGGAWTDRCQHTSWFAESGAFPKVAILVLRSGTTNVLEIYNANLLTSAGVPVLWRAFPWRPLNAITNPRAEGATGATPPTGWTVTAPAGASIAYTREARDGIDGVRIAVTGTTSANGSIFIYPNGVFAGVGTPLTFAATTQVDTDDAAITSITVQQSEYNGGAYLSTGSTNWYADRLTRARRSHARTLVGASTTRSQAEIQSNTINSGTTLNFALWVGGPQFESGLSATQLVLPQPGILDAATWGAIPSSLGRTPTRVMARNGQIWVGIGGGSGAGYVRLDLTGDAVFQHNAVALYQRSGVLAEIGVVGASGGFAPRRPVPGVAGLVSSIVNDVAVRPMPGALLDAAGLPVPVTLISTSAGLSFVHPDLRVVNITEAAGYSQAMFWGDNQIVARRINSGGILEFGALPFASTTHTAWRRGFYASTVGGLALSFGLGSHTSIGPHAVGTTTSEIAFFAEDQANPANGMVAISAQAFATGWQPGDSRLTALCDSVTGSITGGTTADRSWRNVPLNVVGTLSRTSVATGADMAAWSGFSVANYLEQPYSSLLDFGTGNFCVAAWVRPGNTPGGVLLERAATGSALNRWTIEWVNGVPRFTVADGTNTSSVDGTLALTSDRWHLLVVIRRGGTMEMWVNGVREGRLAAPAATGTVTNTSALLRVGANRDLSAFYGGGIAMLRLCAYAPTPAQIDRMWRDERPFFTSNARVTTGTTGTAQPVSIDWSEFSRRYIVATNGASGGVLIYAGLSRVDLLNTTTLPAAMGSNFTAGVSMEGGVEVFQTNANVGVRRNVVTALDRMAANVPTPRAPRRLRSVGATTDTTPLVLAPRLHIGQGETVTVEFLIVGRVHGDVDTERLSYRRRATAYRDYAGNVTLQGAVQIIGTDIETTGTADATLVVDTAAQTLAPQVTGVAATRIEWDALLLHIERLPSAARYEEVV